MGNTNNYNITKAKSICQNIMTMAKKIEISELDASRLEDENIELKNKVEHLEQIIDKITVELGMTWDNENACFHSYHSDNEQVQGVANIIIDSF